MEWKLAQLDDVIELEAQELDAVALALDGERQRSGVLSARSFPTWILICISQAETMLTIASLLWSR